MNESEVRKIVIQTIQELKRSGLLRSASDLNYTEVSSVLTAYYDTGEQDKIIRRAIESIKGDAYYKIIPLYYSYGYTIERIAEELGVEVSTIVRNKKRLCLKIYEQIE